MHGTEYSVTDSKSDNSLGLLQSRSNDTMTQKMTPENEQVLKDSIAHK